MVPKWLDSKMIEFQNDWIPKWLDSKMIEFQNDWIPKWLDSKMIGNVWWRRWLTKLILWLQDKMISSSKICKYQIANFVNIPRSKRRRHHFWLPCLATIPSVSLSFGNLVECQWSPTSAKYKKNKLRNNIPNSKIQGVRIIWMKCKVQVQNYFKREKIEVTATGP